VSPIQFVKRLVSEPAPDYLFEMSEGALASVLPSDPSAIHEEKVAPQSLAVSPASSNLVSPEAYRLALAKLAPLTNGRKPSAALVVPDYALRMAILDFDQWPDSEEQRLALVRFRLRKSLPFAIEEAQVSFAPQSREAGKLEVLTVAIDRRILSEYEDLFTASGFRVGLVVPSSVACLPLCPAATSAPASSSGRPGVALLLKLSGAILTTMLLDGDKIRLIRCVDFSEPFSEEQPTPTHTFSIIDDTMPVMQQTIAYAEDELGRNVNRLLLAGFGQNAAAIGELAGSEFQVKWEFLRSRFAPAQDYAGLLGLLEQYAA
jgi:type IV pilus assembly protein PilM